MNGNDILKILSVLQLNYPHSFKGRTNDDIKSLAKLWLRHFKEYDYATVLNAVDSFISADTSQFAPNIGQIKSMLVKNEIGEELSEQEAWALVYNAICNSGYHSQEEFDKLPRLIQKAVGSPSHLKEWGMTDTVQVTTVVASNFMRSYRGMLADKKQLKAIPLETRNKIEASNQSKLGNSNSITQEVQSLLTQFE